MTTEILSYDAAGGQRDVAARSGPRHPSGSEWEAVYVYYAGSPRPLLLQCVEPLLRELTAANLISGYFFINYWLQGQHVRLRFKTTSAEAGRQVRARAEAAVAAFLAAKPSLFGNWWASAGKTYLRMLDREFPEAEHARYVDAEGRPAMRPNNSFSWEPYEPEYGRYGGHAGMDLAEWHFQHSSDLVIDAMRDVNLHVRTVQLGFSAQLMMVMTATFLPDTADQEEYLSRYHQYWKWMAGTGDAATDLFAVTDEAVAGAARRFAEIRTAITEQDLARLPEFACRWAVHCAELRRRVVRLASAGELSFDGLGEWGERATADTGAAMTALLWSYMHMTNNRLATTALDEAYLSNLLAQTLSRASQAGGE